MIKKADEAKIIENKKKTIKKLIASHVKYLKSHPEEEHNSHANHVRLFGKMTAYLEKVAYMRGKILDDFMMAYVAKTGVDVTTLELVEEYRDNKYVWFFRIKKGRKKKNG